MMKWHFCGKLQKAVTLFSLADSFLLALMMKTASLDRPRCQGTEGSLWPTASGKLRPSTQQPVRNCQQPLSKQEMDPASVETWLQPLERS